MHKIFHHKDLDGYCSGAIIKYYLLNEQNLSESDIIFFPINYGEDFPWDEVTREDQIWMVDFSMQPIDEMVTLAEEAPDMIWIDHHESALNEAKGKDKINKLKGIRRNGDAACKLCWEYCFPEKYEPGIVNVISDFDVWNDEDEEYWEEVVMPVKYALEMCEMDPENYYDKWNILIKDIDEPVKFLVDAGKYVKKYKETQDKKIVNSNGRVGTFSGYKALIINMPGQNSTLFDSHSEKENVEILVTYSEKDIGEWSVGLYEPSKDAKVHCGELAKKLGKEGPFGSGGGHKGAAGFQTDTDHLYSLLEKSD